MRVCVVPSGIDAQGCYRLFFPFRELKPDVQMVMPPMRVFTEYGKTRGLEFNLDELPEADVYVFQQNLDRDTLTVIEWLKAEGKPVVSETDDGTHCLPHYHPAREGTDPRTNPDRNRDWMLKTYRASDRMTVSTPALKELYADVCERIAVLPNFLDWRMWEGVPLQYEQERRHVRVGWMGRAHWRGGDLRVLQGVIGPWLRRNPHVEFVAAGDPEVHDLLDVPHAQRVSTNKIEFRYGDLADITAVMDIGLVPLEMNRFNECKSALKGMEYAACGIPSIASPTESYREWSEGASGCLLAKRTKDWLRLLDGLVNDESWRRDLGVQARAKAERHTIQERVGVFGDFYRGVCVDAHHSRAIGVAA